ncbi:hypothetical protein QTI66_11465 [Variovorax sp. J22R133]|uniref:hypothetical protein n=1 Tax=Variovorax brevis TaxID=3053503 RepID=UPI0025755407|nr:hypothetical protein [Variovorax sp. J22R133]MDM0112768.1 hypothetical protein [Variovorax sp. J22R133]
MNNKEIFESLSEFLIEHGYRIIVDQVREELATGRISEEKISTLAEVRDSPQRALEIEFKKSSTAEFTRRTEYSEADSIVLLLEASRRAISEVTVMVAELRDTLFQDNIKGLSFRPERAGEVETTVAIDESINIEMARGQGAAIDRFIQDIRKS